MRCRGKEVWCYVTIVNKYYTCMQVRQMKLTISARIVEPETEGLCNFHQKNSKKTNMWNEFDYSFK